MSNRWLPVVGGILMNLALGSLYAWSVFVLPLEQEFGWTRADTSWVFTIAIVCFALSFIAAGRLQDLKGPRICAFVGGVLVSAGFMLCSFTSSLLSLYIFFGVIVGIGNGFGYATPTPVGSKWFPGQARPGRRADGRRVRRGLGDSRPARHAPHHRGWMATDVSDSRRRVLRDDDGRDPSA